jgi:hypothetical protein
MIEIVMTFLGVLSASVFLAHAFEALSHPLTKKPPLG